MRPLSILSWNDRKHVRVLLAGIVVAAASAASAAPAVAVATAPQASAAQASVVPGGDDSTGILGLQLGTGLGAQPCGVTWS
ncbi:MAG TPA: hypothetical protein VEK76_06930 [Candidatus Binatia bacterium]|nr:hypothetical protein [Candidatus Binatia bacterium]